LTKEKKIVITNLENIFLQVNVSLFSFSKHMYSREKLVSSEKSLFGVIFFQICFAPLKEYFLNGKKSINHNIITICHLYSSLPCLLQSIQRFSSHTCTTTRWTSFLINRSFTLSLSSALWLCLLLLL